jgi:hypothetical protein
MKRLLALLAGGLGLGALLRRRGRPSLSPPLSPSPADDLRAKLESVKGEHEPVEPVEPVATDESPDVATRRADAHARARQAIDDLGERT